MDDNAEVIMSPVDWIDIATKFGVPVVLLIVVLWYIGKYALPKILTTMQSQANLFAEQLEKERDSARNEAREDRILFREALNQTFTEHKQIVAAIADLRVEVADLRGNIGAVAASAASAAVSAVDKQRSANAGTQTQFKEAGGKG
jgi:hypothetical protein